MLSLGDTVNKKVKKNKSEKPVHRIGSLTRSGALALMRTYRDKIGATLHDKEPVLGEDSIWTFRVTMPFD